MQVVTYGLDSPIARNIARLLVSASEPSSLSAAAGQSFETAIQSIDSRWRKQIAFINRSLGAHLIQLARRTAQIYPSILLQESDSLKRLTSDFRCGGEPAAWEDVAPILIAGLVLDIGVRNVLLTAGFIKEQPQDFWIWVFEAGTCARNALGLRIWGGPPPEASLNELWHHLTQRPYPLQISVEDVRLLSSIAARGKECNCSSWEASRRRSALKLAFYKLLKKNRDCYILNVPALDSHAQEKVYREATRVARRVVSEGVGASIEIAEALCRSEFYIESTDIFKHAFARLLLEHAVDCILECHLLEPFPTAADYPWGCWLNLGSKEAS